MASAFDQEDTQGRECTRNGLNTHESSSEVQGLSLRSGKMKGIRKGTPQFRRTVAMKGRTSVLAIACALIPL